LIYKFTTINIGVTVLIPTSAVFLRLLLKVQAQHRYIEKSTPHSTRKNDKGYKKRTLKWGFITVSCNICIINKLY
jgi:hypothetical protein